MWCHGKRVVIVWFNVNAIIFIGTSINWIKKARANEAIQNELNVRNKPFHSHVDFILDSAQKRTRACRGFIVSQYCFLE